MIVAAGGRVIILDRNPDLGQQLVQELGEASARFAQGDVADPAQSEAAVKLALDSFGALHIDINCAGIGDPQKIVDKDGAPADLDRFVHVIRVNLIGTFNVARLAAAAMSRNQPDSEGERGVIVNTASVAAFDGQIGQAAYSASKGGIVALTLPIARDLARDGIRVMTIAPGLFETPLLGTLPESVRVSLAKQVPFPQRLGQPDEYAALAVHIVENQMLNGETIRLDGAIRMQPRCVRPRACGAGAGRDGSCRRA